ncbi:MAG: Rsd/AlgQ family anti-sigma factor [Methylococcaceae bacterium]|nr:Rsd/AlgQ family anti-sigma factor [Methylococcaceae bacterium]
MSAVMQAIPDRRQHNQHLVSELEQERDQVWSLYCKVADLKPFIPSAETESILTQFSQLLIDYVSLGHFGIYEYLLSGTERREKVLTAAKRIYPEFSKTTEAVIAFNDKYDDVKRNLKTPDLESDLSALGENLAKRIELEDELCHLVLT